MAVAPTQPSDIPRDNIKGLLVGLTLGDACGLPFEFFRSAQGPYTGRIQYPIHIQLRFGHKIVAPVGSVSDDSEMTFALIESLSNSSSNRYDYKKAIEKYQEWANTSSSPESAKMMGTNTRNLFKGVKTFAGYKARFLKTHGIEFSPCNPLSLTASQSNGSLMRSSPLIYILADQPNAIYEDAYLSNPSPVNLECSFIYFNAMRGVLAGIPNLQLIDWLSSISIHPDIKQCIEEAKNVHKGEKCKRYIGKPKKGFVVNSLYCALVGLFFPTLSECLDWVILKGGDTDTNACIAGALYGLKVGWNSLDLRAKENYQKVRIPSPKEILLGENGIEYYVNKLMNTK